MQWGHSVAKQQSVSKSLRCEVSTGSFRLPAPLSRQATPLPFADLALVFVMRWGPAQLFVGPEQLVAVFFTRPCLCALQLSLAATSTAVEAAEPIQLWLGAAILATPPCHTAGPPPSLQQPSRHPPSLVVTTNAVPTSPLHLCSFPPRFGKPGPRGLVCKP